MLPDYDDRRALWGKTLGVVGLGHTGAEVALLGRAFGMRVLAYRRSAGESPVPVDRLYRREAGDSLDELLGESDLVVLATKLTDETHHLIGARELGIMKPSAYLVNMARGGVVDEQALVAALEAGEIAGAGLDVFEQEPLPLSAPIWSAPNVVITPHATPAVPDKLDRSLGVVAENVRRFRAGEPMLNKLEPTDVYTKGSTAAAHPDPSAAPTAGPRQ
ncbi:hypothetical protein BJF90_13815 [Pseudonocardia sp. CNS-004]|nr:hypothetical protein BJF90_13815 [Pseudonocardia sp. CNS-004]